MNIYFSKTLLLIAILFSLVSCSQKVTSNLSETNITQEDLKIIYGDWTGTLTYIDYSSGEPYTMPANLIVKQGKNKNELLLINKYPNEPQANSKEKIEISEDGTQLNHRQIISKHSLPMGAVQFITLNKGKDNKKKALIRNTYILGKTQFIIKKEVQFENSDTWIKRNEYNYKK